MNLRSIEPDALLLAYLDCVGAEAKYDRGRLEAALLHPLTVAAAGSADIATIAVAYASGVFQFKPFEAANARAGLLAMELFLSLNGWSISAPREATEQMVFGLEAGLCTPEHLVNWLRLNL